MSGNNRFQRQRIALTSIAFVAAAGTAASAQEPGTPAAQATDDLPEIIVSARRRDETLISTPVSVTAISGATLQEYATLDVKDIARMAPSLLIDRNGSGAGGTIALRGISTTPSQAGYEQAVSVDIDGVQTSRGRALSIGLLDVEQIEVLRGPQALLFGKNSPAGVISIKTVGPTPEVEGYLKGGYEFEGEEAFVEAAVGGPLTESIGARMALRYRDLGGYFHNQAGQVAVTQPGDPAPPTVADDRPGEQEVVGRLTLSYQPADTDLQATMKLAYSDLKGDGPYAGAQLFYCGPYSTGVTGGVPDPYGDCRFDDDYSSSALPRGVADNWPFARRQPYHRNKYFQGSLDASYDFASFTVSATTGFIRSRTRYSDNFDSTSLYRVGAAEHEDNDTFSQELRLLSRFDAPVNFMVGAFYQNTDLLFGNATRALPLGPDPATGNYHTWDKIGATQGDTYSAFGQIIWNVADELELSGGVRFTRETKDSTLRNRYVHPPLGGVAFVAAGTVLADDYEEDNWSPEATLTWRPTSDLTAFISYKTGFKSGGFGIGAVLSPASATTENFDFDSETVKGFEGGIKGRFLEQRLMLSGSVYTYKYDNLQVNALDARTLSFTIQNAASARIRGVELEGSLRVNELLTLTGSVAYTHARYRDFLSACYSGQSAALGCDVSAAPGADGIPNTADDRYVQDLSDTRLTRAPDWTATTGAQLEFPVSDTFELRTTADARYTTRYTGIDNGHPFGYVNDFWVIDASIQLADRRDEWAVALIGRNLGDSHYTSYLTEKPGAPIVAGQPIQLQGIPSRGRQFVLQVSRSF